MNTPANTGQTPVDRSRRFYFVSRIASFCLLVSALFVMGAGFGILDSAGTLIELFVKALMSLATTVSLAYIGGSVVDYNGGFGNMFTKKDVPPAGPPDDYVPPVEDEEPAYNANVKD